MAEAATPNERTTGGKEAGGIPGVRQAAVARAASFGTGLRGSVYAGPEQRPSHGGGNYTKNFTHGRGNVRPPRYEAQTRAKRGMQPGVRPAVNYNNVGPYRRDVT